jgi:TonB-linked SusC/RagA family outer membrane protein
MMKKIYRSLWMTSVCFVLVGLAAVHAQKQLISGTITDPTGAGLPGVNILIKGSTIGTTSDGTGKYALEAAPEEVLVVSFIGYKSQEIAVGNQTTINVSLAEDLTTLGEVVVVGYGVQDKKVVTGATVAVKSQDLLNTNSLRIEQALQGQTPGVQISSSSGQPGEPLKVRIRGAGTIGDAEPLYLVDGVPTVDISYLNPSLIERVDVLKDGASAAIYGARAANGVVLITTKKGKAGTMNISFDAYYGVQNLYKKIPVLNAKEYAIIMNESAINSGGLPIYTQAQINTMGKGTDWLEEALNENAPIQNYALTASGGSEKSTFMTGLTYFKQEGIIGREDSKSTFDRVTFTINSEHKVVKDIVKLGENVTYTHSNRRGLQVGGIYGNSIRPFLNAPPLYDVYDDEGNFAHSPYYGSGDTNPLATLYYQNFNKNFTDKILGDVYAEVTPIKGLTFRSDIGIALTFDGNHSFNPLYEPLSVTDPNGKISKVTQGLYKNMTWNWDNTVRYNTIINNDHSIELLAGTTAQSQRGFGVGATAYHIIFNDLTFEHNIINNSSRTDSAAVNGNISEYALLSFFGRANYNYKEKYLFTATLRRDGSSNFGPNNRYGTFPSVAVGWVLTEESFINGVVPWLNFLKVRASWGQNGNDRISAFGYLATISSRYRDAYFGSGDTKYIGSSPDKISNPDLKWEASEQTNFGLESTVFNDFTVGVDYYIKKTKDWLITAPVPAVVGTGAPVVNGGAIQNKGVEIQLGYNHTFNGLAVSVNANVAFNRNKVTEIANTEKIIHGPDHLLFQGMTEMYRAQQGYPVGYFYGLKMAGIFQNEEEVQGYTKDGQVIQPNAKPGDVKFVDYNNNGVIDDGDRTMIGNPNPDVTYGLSVNLAYKGFDLSVYTYGMGGQQNVLNTRGYERFYTNYTTDVLGRWHGEGTSNSQPRVTDNQELNGNHKFSELFLHDADFFRIKSLNIGYDFSKLLPNKSFKQIRLYFAANNLFTFTKYSGMDPEIGSGATGSPNSNATTAQNNRTAVNSYDWASGVDVGFYPQPRTYMIGLNVKL